MLVPIVALLAPLGLVVGPAPRCVAPTMKIEGSGVQRLRDATRNLPKHKIALPVELKQLGCDDALWSKIRAKEAFVRLLDAGDLDGAKIRLEQVRNAPSVKGDQWKMPEALASFGCDDELWSKIRSKRALLELSRKGDVEAGRERIAKLRDAIAREEVDAAAKGSDAPTAEQKEAAAKRPARKGSKPRAPRAGSGSKAKPLTDGYTLSGEPPAGADVAAIEKLLAERVEAKLARDFDKADGLQATLVEMGVFCNDRMRTWSSEPAAKQLAAK